MRHVHTSRQYLNKMQCNAFVNTNISNAFSRRKWDFSSITAAICFMYFAVHRYIEMCLLMRSAAAAYCITYFAPMQILWLRAVLRVTVSKPESTTAPDFLVARLQIVRSDFSSLYHLTGAITNSDIRANGLCLIKRVQWDIYLHCILMRIARSSAPGTVRVCDYLYFVFQVFGSLLRSFRAEISPRDRLSLLSMHARLWRSDKVWTCLNVPGLNVPGDSYHRDTPRVPQKTKLFFLVRCVVKHCLSLGLS